MTVYLEDSIPVVKYEGLNSAKDGTLSGTITASGTLNASGTLQVGGTAVTATAAELNAAADVSAKIVDVPDANTAISAANSGKPHIVANVSADRTFTLPAAAAGLDFEFIADVIAADGHDWIIVTAGNTNFYTGSIVHLDTDSDAAGDEIVVVAPDGNSNSSLQINVPQGGTRVRFICDGTTWTVSGFAVSVTAPAFADQA